MKQLGKLFCSSLGVSALLSLLILPVAPAAEIVHDAEYYIIEAQNGKEWAVEDGKLDEKLAELRKKFKAPPNIIHYMWDDQPVMAFGDPIYQKIRGYETPQLNKLAHEGKSGGAVGGRSSKVMPVKRGGSNK